MVHRRPARVGGIAPFEGKGKAAPPFRAMQAPTGTPGPETRSPILARTAAWKTHPWGLGGAWRLSLFRSRAFIYGLGGEL